MNDPRNPMPPDIATYLRSLEERLEKLERSPRLTNASISDPSGQTRVLLGRLDEDENYGLEVFDENGGERFRVDGRGMIDPYLVGVTFDPTVFKATTSGSFTTLWRVYFPILSHEAIGGYIGWAADAATTGELRIKLGANATVAAPLAAGTSGSQGFVWLHGGTLGTGPAYVDVEARRATGAGSINIYTPGLEVRSPDLATLTGLV
jgi:hypothetical protein